MALPTEPPAVVISSSRGGSTLTLGKMAEKLDFEVEEINGGDLEALRPAGSGLFPVRSHHSTSVDFHPPTYPDGPPPGPRTAAASVCPSSSEVKGQDEKVVTAERVHSNGSSEGEDAAVAGNSGGGGGDDDDGVDDDSQYDRFTARQKGVINGLIAWCGLLSPVSSTAVLAAIPEVAASYGTTGSMISMSNAMFLVFMGVSPAVFGPLSQVYGRRWVCVIVACLFLVASIGTALSPNLAAFFFFRILTAFAGTAFLLLGPAVVGDIYRPTERATGMTWFLLGPLIGPTICPFISGVVITYTSWTGIFWFQSALGLLAVIGTVFFMPETLSRRRLARGRGRLAGLGWLQTGSQLWRMANPLRVLALLRWPNLLLPAIGSSALVWTQYSMLTPIRYVLNPRFGLESPIESGLFYFPLGVGLVIGVAGGGRLADACVRRWIRRSGGVRVPEHRLYSCVPFLIAVLPACTLVYGWSVELAVGGVVVPVVFMVLQGFGQMFCYPSINTYCLDVDQERSAEIVSANFMLRYMFGAFGSAVVLPAVQAFGIGWFSTISAAFLLVGGLCVLAAARWGSAWRGWMGGMQ